MITLRDFKSFLKAIINSGCYKSGESSGVTINSIKNDLKYHEDIDVDEFVKKNGKLYSTVILLIFEFISI